MGQTQKSEKGLLEGNGFALYFLGVWGRKNIAKPSF